MGLFYKSTGFNINVIISEDNQKQQKNDHSEQFYANASFP